VKEWVLVSYDDALPDLRRMTVENRTRRGKPCREFVRLQTRLGDCRLDVVRDEHGIGVVNVLGGKRRF
jgi:hypothetical protein